MSFGAEWYTEVASPSRRGLDQQKGMGYSTMKWREWD